MQIIYFTKFLAGLQPEEIGQVAAARGFDGLDLAIRRNHAINPANVGQELPRAMEVWTRRGLSVPLATLDTDWVDPDAPETEAIFAACADAGIPYLKLGYWHWRPGQRYWDAVDDIRRALSEFGKLGESYGVCSLVHTHSGNCYGVNASAAMHLVSGLDPRCVAVYLDPAHLALCGEPLPMALDVAGDYLRMVAAKNARYLPAAGDSGRWTRDWCLLSDGLVDWPAALRAMKEAGYEGPISLHGEYSGAPERGLILERVQQDLTYLRQCVP
jgi:sugar phosphate isomerase/epimerase